jgi:hypothetical protein
MAIPKQQAALDPATAQVQTLLVCIAISQLVLNAKLDDMPLDYARFRMERQIPEPIGAENMNPISMHQR